MTVNSMLTEVNERGWHRRAGYLTTRQYIQTLLTQQKLMRFPVAIQVEIQHACTELKTNPKSRLQTYPPFPGLRYWILSEYLWTLT